MTSKINAITTGAGGIEVTGDSSGQIEFQADGTTVATLTTSGLDVASGLTFGSPIDIASGGTGQTTATASFNALAPTQTGNSGKYLTTDGTNTSWGTVTVPTLTSELTNDSGYITGNQTITLSGDLSGSGTTSINAQLAANVVGANELNVTGNGTTSQYLRSDGDGTFTWATPPDTTANQTITLSGDVSGSGTTAINVTVADDSHNHIISNVDGLQTALDSKAGTSATSNIDMNGYEINDCDRFMTQAENKDVKLGVWSNGYGIGMTSAVTYGSLSDYAMTFCMNNDADRGFWWGWEGQDKSTGAMSLTTGGKLHVNSDITINGAGTLRDVTGEYGSIEVDGGATNGWEGYSIGGWSVFMAQSTVSGIYNDIHNHWILHGTHNGATNIRYAGSAKVTTRSDGATITGNLYFNSGYGSDAIAYGCRAWVNFNGTGTVAIRASGNVSSITDYGTGDYGVNFTTAMSDANYSVAGAIKRVTGNINDRGYMYMNPIHTPTTTAVRIATNDQGQMLDMQWVTPMIVR